MSRPARPAVGNPAAWLALALLALILLAGGVLAVASRLRSGEAAPPLSAATSGAAPVVGVFVQPEDGHEPLLEEIAAARLSVDVEVYLLSDDVTIAALEAAVARGVPVRVLLEEHPFGGDGRQEDTFERLRRAGIDVRWSNPAFRFSHVKTVVVDRSVAVIMNQNLTASAFSQNRELNVVTTRPADVAQAAAIFDADWDRAAEPAPGPLVVSPTNSRPALLALIGGAERTLDVYAEVVRDPEFMAALTDAARRGVAVRVVMSPGEERQLVELRQLAEAGVAVRLVPSPYIHAKLFLVDGRRAFVGSQNMTATSLDQNRELGLIVEEPGAIERIGRVFAEDFGRGRGLEQELGSAP
jgi:phosphatidylserine/phosphatidylglycerophosphate/cardiolipin synthase-like enzyme